MNCRFCGHILKFEFLDLVNSPPSNSYLLKNELNEPEYYFPLKLYVCEKCFLVQIDEYKKSGDIFNEKYAYFSSFSRSWLDHVRNYVDMVIPKFTLSKNSLVIEIASNDGYLLQYFLQKNIPCLGIEPATNTAKIAIEKGIETITDYFNVSLAKKLVAENRRPDLLIGNNVLAHVPNINDFVEALNIILKEKGVITMEFPHLMQLIENNQFDTIYHEHFSYFSFFTVKSIFEAHRLEIFDVEEIPTHGGSLRIYAKHKNDSSKVISKNVNGLVDKEKLKRMDKIEYYTNFQERVNQVKDNFLEFLINQKKKHKIVIAYGAAAKGNTLLNYCGVKSDLIKFIVDASPYKQGKYLPGSHIPILNEIEIKKVKPDFIIIFPWNIQSEIVEQLKYVKEWNCKFVIPIPEVKIL